MKSDRPPVVGLTLNFRDAKRTTACVESLLTEGVDEVLVWDNSEDDGVSAHELKDNLAPLDRVSIEISTTNLGFAAGVNRGVEWITARQPDSFILLINNDAKLLPGAVDRLTDALKKNKDALLCFPDIDHSGRILGVTYYQRWLGLLSEKPMWGGFPYPSGCALLLAPKRFTHPVFDEDFFMYGEDCLLGWQLHHKPSAMVHVPEVLVEHEGSASSGLGSEFYENRIVAAHLILAQKMANNPTHYALLLMGRMFTLPVRALLRAARYHSLIPIKALRAGLNLARASTGAVETGKDVTQENNS